MKSILMFEIRTRMYIYKKIRITFLCLCTIVFLFNVLAVKASDNKGLFRHKLNPKVVLKKRSYYIYIPQTEKNLSELPIYMVLHGGFSTAKKIMKISGFNKLADEKEIIMVYPNGAYGFWGLLQHWNAGHCCGKAQKDKTDDVGFLLNVFDDIKIRYGLKGNNKFLIGFSNGAMLANKFAAEHTKLLSGAAIVSGTIAGRLSEKFAFETVEKPKDILPIIVMHGKKDDSIPYFGGKTKRHKTQREYYSVQSSMDFWIENNKLESAAIVEDLSNDKLEKKVWYGKAQRPMLALYSFNDLAHQWPTNYIDSQGSRVSYNINYLIYEFFTYAGTKHE